MFELCKKVEIHNIHNHYHYYFHNAQNKQILTKPQSTISHTKNVSQNQTAIRKGLKLSKTIDSFEDHSRVIETVKKNEPAGIGLRKSFKTQNETVFNRNSFSLHQMNSKTIQSIYNQPHTQKHISNDRVQQISSKSKPISPATMNSENFSTHFSTLKTQSADNGSRFELTARKMIQSKLLQRVEPLRSVEICSSHRISPSYELQNVKSMQESQSHSTSRLVSISKSISSLHETSKKSKPKISQIFADEKSFEDQQISVNLSLILSNRERDQSRQQEGRRRSFGGMKRIKLLQDLDRNTIESKISRECEFLSDYEIKVEESIVCDHDLTQNFSLLPNNKIVNPNYILSQAVDKNIGMLVSFKQFVCTQGMKMIVNELQCYEVRGKLLNQMMACNILQLYQIQVSENCCILIKESYISTLESKLARSTHSEKCMLIEKAKQISQTIIECFELFNFYPTRKLTTNQFVYCLGVVKLHDLSIFKYMKQPYFSKKEAISQLQ